MSLAKAFSSMRKSGHKMSLDGDCPACNGDACKYANGGEIKGVHRSSMDLDKPSSKKDKFMAGESKAGEYARHAEEHKKSFKGALSREEAVDSHHKVLGELAHMPKPKLQGLAKGGEVKGVHKTYHESHYGVKPSLPASKEEREKHGYSKEDLGESKAGMLAKQAVHEDGYSRHNDKVSGMAKDEHHKVLSELKAMPNPKLKGLADGGEVSDAKDMDMDDDIMNSVCEELFSALKTDNKKEFLESLKALIMNIKG